MRGWLTSGAELASEHCLARHFLTQRQLNSDILLLAILYIEAPCLLLLSCGRLSGE